MQPIISYITFVFGQSLGRKESATERLMKLPEDCTVFTLRQSGQEGLKLFLYPTFAGASAIVFSFIISDFSLTDLSHCLKHAMLYAPN